jgi:hypothetical protein
LTLLITMLPPLHAGAPGAQRLAVCARTMAAEHPVSPSKPGLIAAARLGEH